MIRLRGDGLALLSGVLLALSFPKFGRAPVAWIALAPLLVALARAPGPAHGFRLGYLTGAVSSLGIVYWTATVVVQYGGLRLGVGIVVMAMLCLALALFPSIFGLLVTACVRALGPRGLLLSPVDKGAVYLGKAAAAFVQLIVLLVVTTGIVIVLFGLPVGPGKKPTAFDENRLLP